MDFLKKALYPISFIAILLCFSCLPIVFLSFREPSVSISGTISGVTCSFRTERRTSFIKVGLNSTSEHRDYSSVVELKLQDGSLRKFEIGKNAELLRVNDQVELLVGSKSGRIAAFGKTTWNMMQSRDPECQETKS